MFLGAFFLTDSISLSIDMWTVSAEAWGMNAAKSRKADAIFSFDRNALPKLQRSQKCSTK